MSNIRLRSDDLLAKQVGESRNQIARYIRLTNSNPKILDMVDEEKMDYSNVKIIGIDHGWPMMKNVSHVFTAGDGEIKTEPVIYENLLEYEGRFFRVGGERLTVKSTKITDENYYILTLAAVAKELERRG